VLRPGEDAGFFEPWGENPVLNWARRRLPYQGKERTPDETPLCRLHIQLLSKLFRGVEMQGFQFLSMVRRVLPHGCIAAGLDWCDTMLLSRVPRLSKWCRYVVITLRR